MIGDLSAVATRPHWAIHVVVTGTLSNPGLLAEVVDKYPGGDRVYLADPRAAQVFIAVRSPGSGIVPSVQVPVRLELDIWDREHDKVQVYVNEQLRLTVPLS